MGKYSPAVALGRHISSLLPTEKSVNAMFNGDQVASTLTWVAKNKRFENSKFKFKFARARTCELIRARSQLYRSQIFQVNTRWNWKALVEIYTMHSFAPFSNLNCFVKNC